VDKTFTYAKPWQAFVGVLRGHHTDATGFTRKKKVAVKNP